MTREMLLEVFAARLARRVAKELRERRGVLLRDEDELAVHDAAAHELNALVAKREETAELVRQAMAAGLRK